MPRKAYLKDPVSVKLKVEREDYEYLRDLCFKAHTSFAEMVRELISCLAGFYRGIFGDSLSDLEDLEMEQGAVYIRRAIRFGLLKVAEILDDSSELEEKK